MQKAHSNINWENFPSIQTPVNEQNLNKMDNAIDTIDDRVIALDTSKFNLSDAQSMVKSLTFNRSNGVFTITYFNGSTATIDTMLEKLAVNFDFDEDAQQLIITLDDGTEKRVDLSAFIKPIEFADSGTIAWKLLDDGKVSAIVKEGSIEEKHLQPNYLADIKVETAKAEASAESSAQSAGEAEDSAKLAESHNHGGTGVREGEDTDNSKYWSDQSKQHLDDTVQAGNDAVTNISNAETDALDNISQAEKNSLDAIKNALDSAAPEFFLDVETGDLYYSGGAFVFDLDVNGDLFFGVVK